MTGTRAPSEPVVGGHGEPAAAALTRGATLLLAAVAAFSVAGLYYVQPLLDSLAADFGVSTGRASLLVTATQVGYVLGLLLFGPLGDKISRRRLITALLVLSGIVLAVAAAAPTFWVLAGVLVAVGVTAAAAMVAVPFAASLAAPATRGRVTGTVMSGLLLGILLARTVSGAVAGLAGWRVVFLGAGVVMLLLALGARASLPLDTQPKQGAPLARVMASVLGLVRAEPVLRHRMTLAFVSMFNFSAMWTSIAFLLARHYHYGEAVIGLFGLVGAAGAAAAPVVGRLADGGHGRAATTAGWVAYAAGWGLLWWGQLALGALIAGLLVFDFAAQAVQISNQHRIYALAPEARGRITTAYMVCMFSGGIVGSVASGLVYARWGWTGLSVAGLISVAAGLAWWLHRTDR